MRTFSVAVKWNHKGTKYPKDAHFRVKGTSFAVASNKAIRQVKAMFPASWREPVGSYIQINLTIIDNGKEVDDGRGIRDEQSTQS